jgi:hypothetical protein
MISCKTFPIFTHLSLSLSLSLSLMRPTFSQRTMVTLSGKLQLSSRRSRRKAGAPSHDLPSITSEIPPITNGCFTSISSSPTPSKILLAALDTATATGTTGLGSIKPSPRPTPRTLWDSTSSSRRARSVAEGRRLRRTGLLL